MDKQYLLKSASELEQVDIETAEEYSSKADMLAEKLNTKMENREDIQKLIGSENLEMMKDNHRNHTRFIASILKNHNPDVLVETVLWVFNAYMNHGFASNYWAAQLNSWIEMLKIELSEKSFSQVYPYYEWMQTNIPLFTSISAEMQKEA